MRHRSMAQVFQSDEWCTFRLAAEDGRSMAPHTSTRPKHFTTLDLVETEDDHRRVLAVLKFLEAS